MLASSQRPVELVEPDLLAVRAAASAPPAVVVDLAVAVARPELAAACPGRCIAAPRDAGPPATPADAAALLGAGWRHVLAPPPPFAYDELALTVLKLVTDDVFGLDKHLGWCAQLHDARLVDAADRGAVVDAVVAGVADLSVPERVARQAGVLADELLANAICAAPVDAGGVRPFLRTPRDTPRRLDGRGEVSLRWGFDGRLLAVEVRDRWGSLEPAHPGPVVARHVRAASRDGEDQLGLTLAHGACHQLALAVEPGVRTEALGIIDVRRRPAELGATASFHVFCAAPPARGASS